MKQIPLSQGKFTIVDDENYEWLNQWKWHAYKRGNTYYAERTVYLGGGKKNGKYTKILMHREIMGVSKGQSIDHRNHCGLDNRLYNIRLCTHSQNHQNQLPCKNKSSQYKGVCWDKKSNKWRSRIGLNYQRISLGLHDTEVEAAMAYDEKALELYGEFANINIVAKEVNNSTSEPAASQLLAGNLLSTSEISAKTYSNAAGSSFGEMKNGERNPKKSYVL